MKSPTKISFIFKLLLLTTVTFVTINSCRKDILTNNQQHTFNKIDENYLDIGKLQAAYEAGILKNSITKTNDISHQTLSNMVGSIDVDWSTYTLQDYADSNRVVEFEMPRDTSIFTLGDPNIGDTLKYINKTKAVFLLHKDTLKFAFFMKIIEDITAPGSVSSIHDLKYQQIPSTFTGQIMYFSLDKKFINGFDWKNGAILNTISLPSAPQQTTQNSKSRKTNTVNYVCHSVEVKYLLVIVSDVYLPSMHVDISFKVVTGYVDVCGYEGSFDPSVPSTGLGGAGGVSSGGGGGTPPTNPCPTTAVSYIKGKKVNLVPGGGSSGCPVPTEPVNIRPAVRDITINLSNPCLNAIVNQLKNDNTIQSNVTNTLRNTFGVSNQVNISFTQADLTQTSIGQGSASTSGSQLNNLDVVFNTPVVANASKEYLAEVAMHEIYHAYLYVNPTVRGALSQHLFMAQNYVNAEVLSLKIMYPNLSQHDALCLVIAGYGDLQSGDPTAFNAVLSAYGLILNDVVNTNNSYKNGTKGTHC